MLLIKSFQSLSLARIKMQLKLKNIFSEDKYLEIIKHLEKFKEELNSNLSVKNVVLNLIIQLKKLI